ASPDVLVDARISFTDEMRARIALEADRSLLAVPLLVQGRMFGALAVSDRVGRVFDDSEIRLAQAFADQAALALENARLYTEARRRRLEAVAEGMRRAGDGALLAVPLRAKGRIIGTLSLGDACGRVFSEAEVGLLQAFGDQAALALENARLFSLETARRGQIAALAQAEREFAPELDPDRLLTLVVERATRLFDAHGVIYLAVGGRGLAPRAWTPGGGFGDVTIA